MCYGYGFQRYKKTKCKFGTRTVDATFVDQTKLKCQAPPAPKNTSGGVPFSIYYDGEKYSESKPITYM